MARLRSRESHLIQALREARLYAAEVKALYKTEFNPCRYVFACDGRHLIFSKWDSTIPFAELKFDDIIPTNPKFADLVAIIGKTALTNEADALLSSLTNDADMFRPLNIIGGHSMRNEEVGYNEFGAKLAIDFMHIFSPQTSKQRIQIVRNAYVSSTRREHYADEIDRVVRNALPRKRAGTTLLEDSSNPTELMHALGRGTELQSRVMLLTRNGTST